MNISFKALTLVLGLAGLGLTGLASATTATTTANANLRRLPSPQGQVLRVIPRGTLLTVACTGDWCRTTYQGRGGYIARSLTRPVTGSARLIAPGSMYYASCAALRAAGAAPIRLGTPGYRTGLDSNRNSVACDRGDR
ncbi:excalibur calcium-binding domain-containing protein [Deinococcus frigens]|uniref:excalibur calcium-binding domain-containing protein n=1 Tax=Deinococcus frigens TaxID=249403 RepID=UPI000497F5E0|nr:excalibur calcium-binding domain-containing protein [Deinococcus frigens]